MGFYEKVVLTSHCTTLLWMWIYMVYRYTCMNQNYTEISWAQFFTFFCNKKLANQTKCHKQNLRKYMITKQNLEHKRAFQGRKFILLQSKLRFFWTNSHDGCHLLHANLYPSVWILLSSLNIISTWLLMPTLDQPLKCSLIYYSSLVYTLYQTGRSSKPTSAWYLSTFL